MKFRRPYATCAKIARIHGPCIKRPFRNFWHLLSTSPITPTRRLQVSMRKLGGNRRKGRRTRNGFCQRIAARAFATAILRRVGCSSASSLDDTIELTMEEMDDAAENAAPINSAATQQKYIPACARSRTLFRSPVCALKASNSRRLAALSYSVQRLIRVPVYKYALGGTQLVTGRKPS